MNKHIWRFIFHFFSFVFTFAFFVFVSFRFVLVCNFYLQIRFSSLSNAKSMRASFSKTVHWFLITYVWLGLMNISNICHSSCLRFGKISLILFFYLFLFRIVLLLFFFANKRKRKINGIQRKLQLHYYVSIVIGDA